jgi:hypothetical protein
MLNQDLLSSAAECVLRRQDDPRIGLLPLIESVAANPEQHPGAHHVLGFLQTRLGEVDGRTVRLHIWPEDDRDYGTPNWPIHTHHWTIDSAVVAGHVVNETFVIDRDDGGSFELFAVAYLEGALSERRPIGERIRVSQETVERWDAGQRYSIPLATYHSTTVPERTFAATVILTGVRTDTPPLVVGEVTSDRPSYRYETRFVDPNRWAAELRKLEAAVRG